LKSTVSAGSLLVLEVAPEFAALAVLQNGIDAVADRRRDARGRNGQTLSVPSIESSILVPMAAPIIILIPAIVPPCLVSQ